MLTYILSKEETHQMLVFLESVISQFSPLNNFLIDFEINDSKELLKETMINLKKKKLFPPPFILVNAYDILCQPDRACSILLRGDKKIFASNFFIKNEKVIEYNYNEEGINYVHEEISEMEFLSNILESCMYEKFSNTSIKKSELKYVFSYSEYVVMTAILCLEKDKNVLEIIGEIDNKKITKVNIIDYIRDEEQFESLWLLVGIEFLDLSDFLNDMDTQVDEIINSLIAKGYMSKNSSAQHLIISETIQPLLEYLSSYSKAILTLSVEKYPDKNTSIGYKSGISILLSDKSIFEIKFKDSKLNFFQLHSREQIEGVLKEQLFSIPEEILEEFESSLNEKLSICSICKAELLSDAKFCTQCGTRIVQEEKCSLVSPEPEKEIRKCGVCGVELLSDAKFCTQCGVKI